MSDVLLEHVELPQGARSRGGVLANALPLPEGWQNGIVFYGSGCTEPEIAEPCVVMDTVGARPSEPNEFFPIWIRQSAACSMLSHVGVTDMAAQRESATTEWALGNLLALGTGSGNPALEDAEVVHAATGGDINEDVVNAVSCLEQAVADVGYGALAFLHAPPRAAAWLRSNHLINELGESPAGHRWIISAGYPAGTTAGDDTTVSIWATGAVFAGVSPAYTLRDPSTGRPPVGWQTNTDEAIRQRLGLAAFDPCLNLKSTFVVPACQGAS